MDAVIEYLHILASNGTWYFSRAESAHKAANYSEQGGRMTSFDHVVVKGGSDPEHLYNISDRGRVSVHRDHRYAGGRRGIFVYSKENDFVAYVPVDTISGSTNITVKNPAGTLVKGRIRKSGYHVSRDHAGHEGPPGTEGDFGS